MRARHFRAFALAGMIAVNAALLPGLAKADIPATQPAATVQKESKAPAQMPAGLSDKLKAQTMKKAEAQAQMAAIPSTGAARPGEALDKAQPSVTGLVEDGKLGEGAENGFAYVQPYQEPNDYAHRNFCGPGAAVGLLSHWDAEYAKNADIDALGEAMEIDPNMGVWIKDIVGPVNDYLSEKAGQEVEYYTYGQAESLEEFRWMLDVDIRQNGVPLITGMYTGGMPGWASDVGHIVAVYGYWKDADGTEWVSYMDTAPEQSGYHGDIFVTVELEKFWDAVSGNSAQVW